MSEQPEKKQPEQKKVETTQTEPTQVFQIKKIYTKDISFESPAAPAVFAEEFKPELDVDLNVNSQSLSQGVYHVSVMVTVTTKLQDKVAFLCEVEQAGIFAIDGFADNEVSYLLGVQCPATLFPYVREVVSDLVTRGGFPQLLLEPVNFEAMFANHMEQKTAQAS